MATETVEKKATSSEQNESSKTNLTLINTVLTYLTLIGVGAIVGYTIFASIYNHRCSDMMDEAERTFNRTKEEMSMKLVEALDKNTAHEGAESEVLELRGRLAGQADLMAKHQALLDKHQTTMERLNELQTNLAELQNCPKQVKQLESNVNLVSVQKESAEKRLQQANEKVEQLLEEAKSAGASAACETQLSKSMTHLQKLYVTLCREKYVVPSDSRLISCVIVLTFSWFVSTPRHGEGPYYIEFDLNFDDEGEEESKFVVEISSPDMVPLSVATFLTLVENDIYNDLEFLSTQSIIQLDSDEGKVASLATVASALSLVEAASAGPCTPYSVGFVGSNGALKIIMTNDVSKHGSLACFGKIAQGRQTLSRIQQATRRGKTVAITSVKTIELESKPSFGEGEL